MPKLDGHEVLSQIKGDAQLKRIPVIIMTSSNEEKDLVRSYNNGVNAYIIKPIDFDEFSQTVQQLGHFWSLINKVPNPSQSAC